MAHAALLPPLLSAAFLHRKSGKFLYMNVHVHLMKKEGDLLLFAAHK